LNYPNKGHDNYNDADLVDKLFGLKEAQEAKERMLSGNPVPNLVQGRTSVKDFTNVNKGEKSIE